MPSRHSHSSHSSRSSHHSSHHSHSSHSSRSSSRSHHSNSSRRSVPDRPRYNQPKGFSNFSGHRPTTHVCKKHTYDYYDCDWQYEGVLYHKGYYDENGEYYPSMAFKNADGSYNVYLKCDFCGSQSIMKWREGVIPKCESCGAQLNVLDIPHDEYINDSSALRSGVKGIASVLKWFFIIYFGIFALAFIIIMFNAVSVIRNVDTSYEYDYSEESNVDIWGATIYLKEIEPGRYIICDSADEWDKYMYWDSSEDSYYDYTTGSYAWYNTEVSPNLWQYWFDGISTDYESAGYGWMEYEGGTWYIEVDYGSWIEVPDRYDVSDLWHIDNEFDYDADAKDKESVEYGYSAVGKF